MYICIYVYRVSNLSICIYAYEFIYIYIYIYNRDVCVCLYLSQMNPCLMSLKIPIKRIGKNNSGDNNSFQSLFLSSYSPWIRSLRTFPADKGPRDVVANKLDCDHVVSEFELWSCSYVHFQTNTLGKVTTLIIILC